jgi:hypothetical protein
MTPPGYIVALEEIAAKRTLGKRNGEDATWKPEEKWLITLPG